MTNCKYQIRGLGRGLQLALAFCSLSLFAVPGCGKKTQGSPQTHANGSKGGVLTLATISDPKSFNPVLAKETSTTEALGYLFEGLVKTDGITTEILPCLADSWKVSKDGKEYVFHLRPGVLWSDGQPFDSGDVTFTINDVIGNPDIPSSMADVFTVGGKPILCQALGPDRVRFRLARPFAPFLRSLSLEILPHHILGPAVKEKRFNSAWTLEEDLKNIVGTGPFVLTEYLPSQRLVYKKNTRYWGRDKEGKPLPYLDGIVHIIVPNLESQVLKFQAGETDALTGVRGQDWLLLEAQQRTKNFTLTDAGPNFGSNFLVLNQDPLSFAKMKKSWLGKLFQDLRFRKALAHAVDKDSIIRNVQFGFGQPQTGPESPAGPLFYTSKTPAYAYDLRTASALLNQLGLKVRKSDGVRTDAAGHEIAFEILTNVENDVRVKIAAILQADFAKLGLKPILRPLQFNQLVEKINSTGEWEAVLLGLTGGIEPHFGRNVWWSGGQMHMWRPKQKKPATLWEAEMDRIFDRGAEEMNLAKRKALYARYQVLAQQNLPFIFTCHASALFAIRNSVKNVHPTAYGGAFHNIEEVWIEK